MNVQSISERLCHPPAVVCASVESNDNLEFGSSILGCQRIKLHTERLLGVVHRDDDARRRWLVRHVLVGCIGVTLMICGRGNRTAPQCRFQLTALPEALTSGTTSNCTA